MILNELGYIGLRACTPFLYPSPQRPQGFQRSHSRSFERERTMASLSHLMPMGVFDIPLHEASCCCICEERPATVPECDKGLIDNLKGIQQGNSLKQRIFVQIPVWIRNKVIYISCGEQRRNSQIEQFWCIGVAWTGALKNHRWNEANFNSEEDSHEITPTTSLCTFTGWAKIVVHIPSLDPPQDSFAPQVFNIQIERPFVLSGGLRLQSSFKKRTDHQILPVGTSHPSTIFLDFRFTCSPNSC